MSNSCLDLIVSGKTTNTNIPRDTIISERYDSTMIGAWSFRTLGNGIEANAPDLVLGGGASLHQDGALILPSSAAYANTGLYAPPQGTVLLSFKLTAAGGIFGNWDSTANKGLRIYWTGSANGIQVDIAGNYARYTSVVGSWVDAAYTYSPSPAELRSQDFNAALTPGTGNDVDTTLTTPFDLNAAVPLCIGRSATGYGGFTGSAVVVEVFNAVKTRAQVNDLLASIRYERILKEFTT